MGTVETRIILGFLLVNVVDDKTHLPHLLLSLSFLAIVTLVMLHLVTIENKQM